MARPEPKHPAPFSEPVLDFIAGLGVLPRSGILLDPFAGVGRVHRLGGTSLFTVGIEIEPEWAVAHPRTLLGDATALPFAAGSIDVVVTSCVYGNRMSDSHFANDASFRVSYTHVLRAVTGDRCRKLHPNNAGTLYAWSQPYWDLHEAAWAEVVRVLRPGGCFVLNVSNFVRRGEVFPVAERHAELCVAAGLLTKSWHVVPTRRLRYGANRDARVTGETVIVMEKPT